jgi:hypothetical protein
MISTRIILPEEIISKIMLFIPSRYPFLDCIRNHLRTEYSIIKGGIYDGALSIRNLDEDGYTYDIIDFEAKKRFNIFLNDNYNYLAPISPSVSRNIVGPF